MGLRLDMASYLPVMLSKKILLKLRKPLWILGLALSLVVIWFIFGATSLQPSYPYHTKERAAPDSPRPEKQSGQGKTKAVEPQQIRARLTRPLPRPKSASPYSNDSKRIGELIASPDLSHDEIATRLAKIALDNSAPESERLEAMEHGANLSFSHLVPLSLDPNLPLPIAESYLHGLYGHDQVQEQVSGAVGLLNHVDQEIREQAQILLGFLLQAEEDNEAPDKLREKADAFMQQPDEQSELGADPQ